MISLTGLLIQSSPSYTPVCPGDTVIFTCSSTTGRVSWALNSDGTNNIGYTTMQQTNIPSQLGIFTLVLVSISGDNLTSTATVHSVTINQTGTDIYCAIEIGNFNQMDTLSVRS